MGMPRISRRKRPVRFDGAANQVFDLIVVEMAAMPDAIVTGCPVFFDVAGHNQRKVSQLGAVAVRRTDERFPKAKIEEARGAVIDSHTRVVVESRRKTDGKHRGRMRVVVAGVIANEHPLVLPWEPRNAAV